jgi:hypothetical protein
MDEKYRHYYRERLVQLQADQRRPTLRRLLRSEQANDDRVADNAARLAVRAAQAAAAQSGSPLREDGELVIYLLARELVARPVAAVRAPEQDELAATLSDDAATIARRAAELSSEQREVSAHRVIDALAGTWGDLRSGRFNLWDRGAGR